MKHSLNLLHNHISPTTVLSHAALKSSAARPPLSATSGDSPSTSLPKDCYAKSLLYNPKQLLLLLLAGISAGLSFAPVYFTPGVFGISYLLSRISKAEDIYKGFKDGYVFGIGFFLTTLYWIAFGVSVYPEFWWAIPFALLGLPSFLAIFTGLVSLFTTLYKIKFSNHKLYRILNLHIVFCTFWIIYEVTSERFLTGLPWALLGYSFSCSLPLLQTASITGVFGLSSICVYLASSFYSKNGIYLRLIINCLIIGIMFCWGQYRLDNNPTEYTEIKARIVQASIPQTDKWKISDIWDNIDKHLELSKTDSPEQGDILEHNNKLLQKLAIDEEFAGDAERKTAARSNVHEDPSTESTHKLPSIESFAKKSNLADHTYPNTIAFTNISQKHKCTEISQDKCRHTSLAEEQVATNTSLYTRDQSSYSSNVTNKSNIRKITILRQPDLIIWPEAALIIPYYHSQDLMNEILQLLCHHNTTNTPRMLITGAATDNRKVYGSEEFEIYSSMIGFSNRGFIQETLSKNNPNNKLLTTLPTDEAFAKSTEATSELHSATSEYSYAKSTEKLQFVLELHNNPNNLAPSQTQDIEDVSHLGKVYEDKYGNSLYLAFEYHKSHLVPFGEYIPMKSILPIKKITPGLVDYTQGNFELINLKMIDTRISHNKLDMIIQPQICYESIFSSEMRRSNEDADLIINITNDAWYGNSSGPYQHLEIARMRAIENGLPMIRAANNGISAFIDPMGRVLHKLKLNDVGVLDSFIPKKLKSPTYFSMPHLPL